jgi:hypothetical protein
MFTSITSLMMSNEIAGASGGAGRATQGRLGPHGPPVPLLAAGARGGLAATPPLASPHARTLSTPGPLLRRRPQNYPGHAEASDPALGAGFGTHARCRKRELLDLRNAIQGVGRVKSPESTSFRGLRLPWDRGVETVPRPDRPPDPGRAAGLWLLLFGPVFTCAHAAWHRGELGAVE